jgi:hypothetical protein
MQMKGSLNNSLNLLLRKKRGLLRAEAANKMGRENGSIAFGE